jgi:hypothetical protein
VVVADTSLLLPTEDGSLTLFHPGARELYHNQAGAYTEAYQNYFAPSGAVDILRRKQRLRVLDACYGLGYNSFVLLSELFKVPDLSGHVQIVAIEIDEHVLGYSHAILSDHRFAQLRSLIAAGNNAIAYPERFGTYDVDGSRSSCTSSLGNRLSAKLEIRQADLRQEMQELSARHGQDEAGFDLIFHDAFSPRKVPRLWTVDLFGHYARLLSSCDGRMLTYSTSGAVRMGLLMSGFFIYKTTPVGRKKGGTLAALSPIERCQDGVYELSLDEKLRLKSGACVPYRDAESADPQDLTPCEGTGLTTSQP